MLDYLVYCVTHQIHSNKLREALKFRHKKLNDKSFLPFGSLMMNDFLDLEIHIEELIGGEENLHKLSEDYIKMNELFS